MHPKTSDAFAATQASNWQQGFEAAREWASSMQLARRSVRALPSALVTAVRTFPAAFAWVRALPRLDLLLDDNAAGRDVRQALMHRHVRLISGRAVAVLALPDAFGAYLRGRHRQAVRTNRRRGLLLGLEASAVTSTVEALEHYRRLVRHDVLYATEVLLLERIEQGVMQIWFVRDTHGDCLAAASITLVSNIARIDILQVALDLEDRSAAQYVLSTEIIRSLIESGVEVLLTDSMPFSTEGVVYLERRLGFTPMNITVSLVGASRSRRRRRVRRPL